MRRELLRAMNSILSDVLHEIPPSYPVVRARVSDAVRLRSLTGAPMLAAHGCAELALRAKG